MPSTYTPTPPATDTVSSHRPEQSPLILGREMGLFVSPLASGWHREAWELNLAHGVLGAVLEPLGDTFSFLRQPQTVVFLLP